MAELFELYERALDETDRLVGLVRPDQMDRPTPCSEWKLRDLLRHLIEGNWRVASVAQGTPPAQKASDLPEDQLVQVYHRSVGELKEAWREPRKLEREYDFGSGTKVIQGHLLDCVAHGWDVARAVRQEPSFDPDVVQSATLKAWEVFADQAARGSRYGAVVKPPPDASGIDILAALLGRRV